MQSYCDFLSGTLHVRVNALLDSLCTKYNCTAHIMATDVLNLCILILLTCTCTIIIVCG